MKKFMNFMNKLSENYKWNMFIVMLFLFFMLLDLITGDIIYAIADSLIAITEFVSFKRNFNRNHELNH